MRRSILPIAVLLAGEICAPLQQLVAQDAPAVIEKADAFFAGSVVESTPERLVVSRTVLGKTESRTFALTSDTKVEGQLALKARVTVRYASDDNGDTALLVVVRGRSGSRRKK
jgi:hypothetical protein